MCADRSRHPIVHLVGSIPLPDAETVFRTVSSAVWMIPKIRTPIIVPASNPTPPLRSVPPITTAAIASNSSPLPALGFPEKVYRL